MSLNNMNTFLYYAVFICLGIMLLTMDICTGLVYTLTKCVPLSLVRPGQRENGVLFPEVRLGAISTWLSVA